MTRAAAIVQTVILDRLMICEDEIVEALGGYYKRSPPSRLESFDAYRIRHMIDGWGKTSRVELRCPATWWDHAKLALRERWPRIFGRLVVRFTTATADSGAIVAGLQATIGSRHLVIPYRLPTTFSGLVEDGKLITRRSRE